jgi:PTS system mannose-specific IIA component
MVIILRGDFLVEDKSITRPAILILGHGHFASGLLSAVEEIMGEVPDLSALDLDLNDKSSRDAILRAVENCDRGGGVIVFVDLFGGSPSNLAISLLKPGSVEILCGVNLPMVLRAIQLRDKVGLSELVEDLLRSGREQIVDPSRLLSVPRR